MRIDIITLFPELLRSPFEASIVKRAIEGKKVDVVGLRWLQDLYYSDVPNLLPFFEKCF